MSYMSNADIEVKEILEWEMDENEIKTEHDRHEYIQLNRERVGKEVLRRLATAAGMVQ